MKDINKTRLAVWSVIFVITLTFTIVGALKYKQGYGRGMQAKEDLEPIVQAFNASTFITSYKAAGTTIKAENKSNYVLISLSKGINTTTYLFNYKEEGIYRLIELKYTEEDKQNAEVIARGMIEATAMAHGGKEGDVFNSYTYDEFRRTSLADGVVIINTGTDYTIKINIEENVASNLKQKDVAPEEEAFTIEADPNESADNYINYTMPEGFENKEKTTANNKCSLLIDVITKYTSSEEFATDLSKEIKEDFVVTTNDTLKIYKDTETSEEGKLHFAALDAGGRVVLFRMKAESDNDECYEELTNILNTVTLK